MKKTILAVSLLACAVTVYLLVARVPAPQDASAGKTPALSGPTLDGKAIALADFSGRVVLVDFWATWCGPCQEEIPGLVKLRDRLKSAGFEILGVSMDEDGVKAVKKFSARQPISYPIILNGGERPPTGWSVPGLPTAYLIGRDGTVLKRWFGEKDMDELERDVRDALARK